MSPPSSPPPAAPSCAPQNRTPSASPPSSSCSPQNVSSPDPEMSAQLASTSPGSSDLLTHTHTQTLCYTVLHTHTYNNLTCLSSQSLHRCELTFLPIDVIQEVDGVFHYTVTDIAVITGRENNSQSEQG